MDAEITRGGTRYKKGAGGTSLVLEGTRYSYRHNDYRHNASLDYQGKDNGVHAVLGYAYRKVWGYDFIADKASASNATLDGEIFDVQKNWKIDADSLVVGYSYKREAIDTPAKKRSAVRTGNSLYASYSKQFTPRFNFTLGLRGE